MASKKKMPVAKIVTLVITGTTLALFVFGAITPPPGVIDDSLLKAAGILLGFASLWVTAHTIIEVYNNAKVSAKVGNVSVDIDPEDEEDNK